MKGIGGVSDMCGEEKGQCVINSIIWSCIVFFCAIKGEKIVMKGSRIYTEQK